MLILGFWLGYPQNIAKVNLLPRAIWDCQILSPIPGEVYEYNSSLNKIWIHKLPRIQHPRRFHPGFYPARYSAAAKLAGWRVPHSPIRPAYFSGCVWAVGQGHRAKSRLENKKHKSRVKLPPPPQKKKAGNGGILSEFWQSFFFLSEHFYIPRNFLRVKPGKHLFEPQGLHAKVDVGLKAYMLRIVQVASDLEAPGYH